MNRKELEFCFYHHHYIHGGTKVACIKARQFVRYAEKDWRNQLDTEKSEKARKFLNAVKTLMAFTFGQKDTPIAWHDMKDIYEELDYLPDGTKKACVVIRDFLLNERIEEYFDSQYSCIGLVEFMEAVKALASFAFKQEDTVPKTWYCDNDCRRVSDFVCPGEFNLNPDAEKLCPSFSDEGDV